LKSLGRRINTFPKKNWGFAAREGGRRRGGNGVYVKKGGPLGADGDEKGGLLRTFKRVGFATENEGKEQKEEVKEGGWFDPFPLSGKKKRKLWETRGRGANQKGGGSGLGGLDKTRPTQNRREKRRSELLKETIPERKSRGKPRGRY